MKVAATKSAPKSTRPANSRSEEVTEVEEVEEVQPEAAIVDDPTAGPDHTRTPANTELVRFALSQDIEPSPRIGKFDMLHFTGKSKLEKGIHDFPREVAVVLQDKGYGSIV